MNIGITATRDGLTGPQLKTIREKLLPYTINCGPSDYLHQGCCVGGDEQITIIAFTLGLSICAHPPVDRRYYFSKTAYELANYMNSDAPFLDRNHHIVDHSNIVIAAPKTKFEDQRSGTWATIRYARKLNKHIIIVYTDGGFDEFNV